MQGGRARGCGPRRALPNGGGRTNRSDQSAVDSLCSVVAVPLQFAPFSPLLLSLSHDVCIRLRQQEEGQLAATRGGSSTHVAVSSQARSGDRRKGQHSAANTNKALTHSGGGPSQRTANEHSSEDRNTTLTPPSIVYAPVCLSNVRRGSLAAVRLPRRVWH